MAAERWKGPGAGGGGASREHGENGEPTDTQSRERGDASERSDKQSGENGETGGTTDKQYGGHGETGGAIFKQYGEHGDRSRTAAVYLASDASPAQRALVSACLPEHCHPTCTSL